MAFFMAPGRVRDYTEPMPTVLIVDDNEQNLYMLRVLLESHGYQVAQAFQGAEALEVAGRTLPDLAITDILMPVMDGFSLCRRWKSDPSLKGIPFVFYTATYTDARDEEFALSLGADYFLVKPQDPQRLLEVVAELLKSSPQGGEADAPLSETEFLKSHNIALFQKLEKKVADLEAVNAALQRDIALRRGLEIQLVQAQKMELLGQIAGGIVHDFNNVLTVIGGVASLLTLEPREPELLADRVAKIQEAVRMGAALSRQILVFSRKQELSLVPLDLDQLIHVTLPLIRATLPSSIALELIPSGGLPLVKADANQLKQVFLNLASNARDAITPPGRVVIDMAVMELDDEFVRYGGEKKPGKYVRVRFHDTGAGMPQEILDKIFDPFFTTKEAGVGTGLGLSMAYGIVRQHEGFLQVSSVVGRGSCFEIYLPVSSEGK
jgi:signal transduction histidine kinase